MRSRSMRELMFGSAALLALLVFGSGCSLAFEQHSAVSTTTTVPSGPIEPGSQPAAIPSANPTPSEEEEATSTTAPPTTTTTMRYFSGISPDQLQGLAGQSADEMCDRTDAVVVSGATVGNFGSTAGSRPVTLTKAQRAAVYEELLRFRDEATTLVDQVAALGLLPAGETIRSAMERFGQRVDAASPNEDVRQLFANFIQTDGIMLQRILTDVMVPRCPGGLLAKLDPASAGSP